MTSYRSNRSGPVSVWAGIKLSQIQNLNLNSKNEKFLKILQGVMNLMVSNFLKNSFIQYSLRGFEVKKNVHIKVYKYNIKVVQKRVGGFI